MGKESIFLGIMLVVLGVVLFFLGAPLAIPIVLVLIGVFLLIFWNAEDKIEERKDIKTRKEVG